MIYALLHYTPADVHAIGFASYVSPPRDAGLCHLEDIEPIHVALTSNTTTARRARRPTASRTGMWNPLTNLINMKGRIYDPKVGRFLTPDPLVQSPLRSESQNRYSYAWNNPLKWVDPSGFQVGVESQYDPFANFGLGFFLSFSFGGGNPNPGARSTGISPSGPYLLQSK